MSNYTLFPNNDKQQVAGGAITATSTVIDGGSSIALGTAVPTDSVLTDQLQLGGRSAVHGAQVVQRRDLFGAFHTAAVTITAVADDGNGFCDFELTSHGLSVGDVVNVTGSTSGNVDGVQKITSLHDANSFVTDQPYVASATAGNYNLVDGRFASMTAATWIIKGYTMTPATVAGTFYTYGINPVNKRSIHKLEAIRTERVATAIRAGYWNIYTGSWTTAPTVANDIGDAGTDEAATPTRAIPGELVYRVAGQPDGTNGITQADYPAKTNG